MEFYNCKKTKSIDVIPQIHIDYKDKGLLIFFAWWWWAVSFELKKTKHDVMGNKRR